MVDIVVNFNSKKVIETVNKEINTTKDDLTNTLLQTLKTPAFITGGRYGSPVRGGKFIRSWKVVKGKNFNKIINGQPYGELLDKGRSRQAPRGVVKPSVEETIKRVSRKNKIRRD